MSEKSLYKNFPNKKYNVIVVDPPWRMEKIKRQSRPKQIGFDYETLTVKDIMKLDISSISEKNCFCFIWTTQKYLPKTFLILKHWGFKYLLTMTWNKKNGLCLFGFHWKTEYVLVGYKGKPKIYKNGKAIPTVFNESSWRKHSVKPNIFYNLIEKLGNKRIDVFARKKREGWDAWGNEINQQKSRQSRLNWNECN